MMTLTNETTVTRITMIFDKFGRSAVFTGKIIDNMDAEKMAEAEYKALLFIRHFSDDISNK